MSPKIGDVFSIVNSTNKGELISIFSHPEMENYNEYCIAVDDNIYDSVVFSLKTVELIKNNKNYSYIENISSYIGRRVVWTNLKSLQKINIPAYCKICKEYFPYVEEKNFYCYVCRNYRSYLKPGCSN